jgi:hypothetical protein
VRYRAALRKASLALYDTIAGYVARDQIDEDVVLDAWHHPLSNIAEPVRRFMAHHEEQNVRQPWTHLLDLLAKAEQYPCHYLMIGADHQ